ncbi:MAG: 4-(cytidine 5'-diphospho)-2-C-methyl-D-erythritol kinase [Phycisphaerae bacterium]|nr:4-(cytidine 5'-diphospho)-2-C-methyl-D-erythritol kinase [Phycisphaerae bacterium]MCZ2400621.1 4-(cytidine 5'-diphospho)-2-C-methyl-D-erythritol kinase [Phycisphaerae bacterium]
MTRRKTALAPAKINLTLRVGPRRDDGFHEVESLVLLVPLCDEVAVEARDDGRLTLDCDCPDVPRDERNLALRAAALLRDVAVDPAGHVTRGAHIRLVKRIPPGMGLGGGSSDAAAVLTVLNDLWHVGWPRDRLAAEAAALGSDVPLFFGGPLAVVSGRGERVRPLPLRPQGAIVLVLPALDVSTAAVYAAFDTLPPPPARPSADALLARVAGETCAATPAERGVDRALPLGRLATELYNDLFPAAQGVEPRLERLHALLSPGCASGLHLTGSGAALFCIPAREVDAERVAGELRERIAAEPEAAGAQIVVLRP